MKIACVACAGCFEQSRNHHRINLSVHSATFYTGMAKQSPQPNFFLETYEKTFFHDYAWNYLLPI